MKVRKCTGVMKDHHKIFWANVNITKRKLIGSFGVVEKNK
jgi:hypothetical protein